MTKVFFRGSHEKAKELALQLGVLIGTSNHPIGRAFLSAVGFAALSDIKQAFIVKAKGGQDAMGITWPPLDPKTIAKRRVGQKDKKDNPAIKEREKIFKREERKLLKRFSLSLPPTQAKARARQIAGIRATKLTGLTKVQTLGGRTVEILRDTGILFNSLSPGQLTPGAGYQPTEEDQVFQLTAGSVIVGTNVKYAATHNYGSPKRNIPRRQFLPDDEGQVPDAWWDNWFNVGQLSMGVAFKMMLDQEGT